MRNAFRFSLFAFRFSLLAFGCSPVTAPTMAPSEKTDYIPQVFPGILAKGEQRQAKSGYLVTSTSLILSRPRKNLMDEYSRKRVSTCRLLKMRCSRKALAGWSSSVSFEAML